MRTGRNADVQKHNKIQGKFFLWGHFTTHIHMDTSFAWNYTYITPCNKKKRKKRLEQRYPFQRLAPLLLLAFEVQNITEVIIPSHCMKKRHASSECILNSAKFLSVLCFQSACCMWHYDVCLASSKFLSIHTLRQPHRHPIDDIRGSPPLKDYRLKSKFPSYELKLG